MPEYNLTATDLTGAGMSGTMEVLEMKERAEQAGYTAVVATRSIDAGVYSWVLYIAESPTQGDLLTALAGASYSPLTVDVSSLNITADGVATGTFNFTGPANHTVNFTWQGTLPISAAQITLDGVGSGSVTLGPTTQITSADGVDVVAAPSPCVSEPLLLNVVFS